MQTEHFHNQRLTGKAFEKILVEQHGAYKKQRLASIGRYGVQVSIIKGGKKIVLQSLPDFEGSTEIGKHIIFDAKVCSQASFNLAKFRAKAQGARRKSQGARRRQLSHMYDRSVFKTACFFLIHWNERLLKTKTEPSETFVFPVHPAIDFWKSFEAGEVKSINRDDCVEYGSRVNWAVAPGGRKPRPDWLAQVKE